MRRLLFLFPFLFLFLASTHAQPLPTIEAKTAGFQHHAGFFPIYWDAGEGKIWLEIPRFDGEFLYVVSQPAGLGSNDVGLDRTQLGSERVVRFERVGPKILLAEPNLHFRASSDNPAERASVADAFAPGVVWGFTAAAETDGRVLVDATEFVVRDAHGAARMLRRRGQGSFELDPSRSAVHLPRTKAFPENTEMEARLTLTSEDPGGQVRQVAADPHAIALRVRHSFVKLPPPGYEPRLFDPRSGYSPLTYEDYSAPIGEEMTQRLIKRHRLEISPSGEVVEPIVYYLDPGTPEPVRSALLEGARWWAEAFERAGFPGAYRVEILPENADPMDVRYNVIQWVHRATRGWSYGQSFIDPRTGEIIKGHVLLGSLRVRQDYLIAEGLLMPYEAGVEGGYPAEDDPMLAMALARIRQLSAHEVGHTLGLSHNFAASVDDRASVMDYPAPLAQVDAAGDISLANAYDTGIGEWDVAAIRYGYSVLPDSIPQREALEQIIAETHRAGLRYITDADARPAGAAHPRATLWDNGADPIDDLAREMRVREVALEKFGLAAIRAGRPIALLEEALVPLYLRHRYQLEGTAKAVGGVEYAYAMRGDDLPLPAPVPAAMQRAAVDALLETVTPSALALPRNVRMHLPPRPPGYGHHRELFEGYSGLIFDPYAPAEVAAAMAFEALLNPERAARLVYQHDADGDLPSLTDVLDRVTEKVWRTVAAQPGYEAELARIAQQVWTDELLALAQTDRLAPAVRAQVNLHLRELHTWLAEQRRHQDTEELAHRAQVYDELDRYLFRDFEPGAKRTELSMPPGSPIGAEARVDLRRRQLDRYGWMAGCGN